MLHKTFYLLTFLNLFVRSRLIRVEFFLSYFCIQLLVYVTYYKKGLFYKKNLKTQFPQLSKARVIPILSWKKTWPSWDHIITNNKSYFFPAHSGMFRSFDSLETVASFRLLSVPALRFVKLQTFTKQSSGENFKNFSFVWQHWLCVIPGRG